jgi:hypothetical protein
MKIESKIGILLSVFIVIVFLTSYLTFVSRKSNLTAATTAEILEIHPKHSRESDGFSVWSKKQNVLIVYQFDLNGERLRGDTTVGSNTATANLKVGEKVKLCYNPHNHKEVEINCRN